MISVLALLSLAAQADGAEATSRFERFLQRPGVVLARSFVTVGELHWQGGPVRVLAVKAVESDAKNPPAFALRLELPSSDKRPSDTGVFVDPDEVPDLAAGVEKMSKLAKDWASNPRERDDARMRSRGGFSFGVSQAGLKQWIFMGLGDGPKGHLTSNSTEALRELKDLLDKGAAKLKELGLP